MATGYLGADKVLTSTVNQEVLPVTPENWTADRYSFSVFSFINYDSCVVQINGGEPIFLNAEQGFECSRQDPKIKSFVIISGGIRFSWLGVY